MSTQRPTVDASGTGSHGRSAREIALAAEVAALEAELDRRDRQLRELVDSYEALLETQARAGREAEEFVWTDPGSQNGTGSDAGLLARVRTRLPSG